MDDLLERARALLAQSASWHDLRRRLNDAGLTDRLGMTAMEGLLAEWHTSEAAAMSDQTLADELTFWADGGTYSSHLKGYSATSPAVLLEQARTRGWFVKPLGSGGVVINPPGGHPLVIRGLLE